MFFFPLLGLVVRLFSSFSRLIFFCPFSLFLIISTFKLGCLRCAGLDSEDE